MNEDIMEAFPIPPESILKKHAKLLSILSKILMKQLFINFDKKHNRFNTSNVKPFIDLCDITLGEIYGLSKEEIEYVLNFESEIRGGKQLHKIRDSFKKRYEKKIRIDDYL